MLKILGAGLPRTGTKTLCEALRMLRFNAIHHEPKRLRLFTALPIPQHVAVYDNVDAVLDCPAAMYWREIYQHYKCKVILTSREPADWWESIKWHTNQIRSSDNMSHIRYTDDLHGLLFGVATPHEYWWRRRYEEHNQAVRDAIPSEDLLEMDIVAGDKWDNLCEFLDVPKPDAEFPWEHRRRKPCLIG